MPDIQLHIDLDKSQDIIFDTWLNAARHGGITESLASIDPRPEGKFSLWGGVVTGKFIEIDRPKKIVQTWRTVEFPSNASSLLTLKFKEHRLGTRLIVTHENIPAQMLSQFEFAWNDFYFPRLSMYFAQKRIH